MKHLIQYALIYIICLLFTGCKVTGISLYELSDIISREPSSGTEQKIIKINKGIYRIEHVMDILNKQNLVIDGQGSTIVMEDGAPVKNGFSILNFRNCSHIKIKNFVLDGNRNHRKCAETYAHTVTIVDSRNVALENITIINSAVDGIYIGADIPSDTSTFSKYITLKNCKAINSYRNGLSVINGYHIKIENSEFSESNGTRPECGIDIEADLDLPIPSNKGISVTNCVMKGNKGWGIMTSQKGSPKNIMISGNKISNCEGGIFAASIKTSIYNNIIMDCTTEGIKSVRYDNTPVDSNIVSDNNITGCNTGISYTGSGGNIKGNNIDNSRDSGIWLNGNTFNETDCVVSSNTITNAGKYGICANNFGKSSILSNQIKHTSVHGILVTNGIQQIVGNTIQTKKTGIESIASRSEISANNFIDCNIAINIAGGGRFKPEGTISSNTYTGVHKKISGEVKNFSLEEQDK